MFFEKKALRCFALYLLVFCHGVFAQQNFRLQCKNEISAAILGKNNVALDSVFSTNTNLENALVEWQKEMLANGFLTANVDSLQRKDSIYTAYLFIGKRYEWATLRNANIPLAELDKIGFRERLFSRKPFDYRNLIKWMDKIITYQENHGYPFARIYLDSIKILETGKISADLRLEKNKLIRLGTIKLENDSTGMSEAYLARYLDLLPNAVFEKNKIKNIKQRIRELPFLALDGDPYLTFEGKKATVHLTLKRVKASRFDALLGILPQQNTPTAASQRFTLTGNLNLDLQNAFNKGERLMLDFQRFKADQQEFKMQINYPFIANLPVGADLNFGIFKRETSFTTVEYAIGGRYIFTGSNFLKIYWQGTQNNLGEIDSLSALTLAESKSLPENLDVDTYAYGIELLQQQLDYRFNPRKGWSFSLKSDVGTRTIRKNNAITGLKNKNEPLFDFNILYDTLQLRSLRFQGTLQAEYYLPLFAQSTIKLATKASGIFAQTPIFSNEQYRVGGNRLLRGFDENSIYATRMWYTNLEYRFLFGQNSFFSLFSDGAYVENITSSTRKFNTFLGFGAGMNFETRAGIFSLSYALGKINKNPIDARNGKIHFGYLSLF